MNKLLKIIFVFAIVFGTIGVQNGTVEDVFVDTTKHTPTTNRT